jgi:YVTN family beta-propeller protein
MRQLLLSAVCISAILLGSAGKASADAVVTTVTTGSGPEAIAIDSVTDKIYVTNYFSNDVTVIDGATNSTTTVGAGTNPWAIGVNPVTNMIYVANYGSNTVTAINGANNSTDFVNTGALPIAIVVNPVSNKIYVANYGRSGGVTVINGATNATATVSLGSYTSALAVNSITNNIYVSNLYNYDITIIDGATNSTTTLSIETEPGNIAVNPVTNKIYAINYDSIGSVTIIDGTTNATNTVSAGSYPYTIAVNSLTNMIYVANQGNQVTPSTVTVINGMTNSTAIVNVGVCPYAIAVNTVTDKIYVANYDSIGSVTIIDGATNATNTVSAGSYPYAIAVNSLTNMIYVANENSNNVTVIGGVPAAVTLLTPINSAKNIPLKTLLSWNPSSGAMSYEVQLSTDSTFSTFGYTTDSMTQINADSLSLNTIYYWRVNASNSYGTSDWSATFNFTTNASGVLNRALRFNAPNLGYSGTLIIYSLNGRQVLRIPFAASATREAVLRSTDNIRTKGFYIYQFFNDRKVMDKGNFLVK